MKTETLLLIGGAAVAVYLLTRKPAAPAEQTQQASYNPTATGGSGGFWSGIGDGLGKGIATGLGGGWFA